MSLAFEITSSFGVDVRSDKPDRHPSKICELCATFIRRSSSAEPSSLHLPETNMVPQADWPECQGNDCHLRVQWKNDSKGGCRPKPKGGKRGRPKGTTECDTKALGLVEENLGSVVLPSQSNSVLSARVES